MEFLAFIGNIHIVGLGVAETAVLTPQAEQAITSADAVIGSERQLQTIAPLLGHIDTVSTNTVSTNTTSTGTKKTDKQIIPTVILPPLSELKALIQHLAVDAVNKATEHEATYAGSGSSSVVPSLVILASGDPLHYGIGRWLSQHIHAQQLHFYPAVSSIQAACHQVGLSLQDVNVLSLHGRPLAKIRTQLQVQQPLVILTDCL